MSDLISRSELLKRFCINKDGHRIPERDCDNFEVTVSVKDIKTIIKEQPTAYNVDKVVEELELHSFEFGTDSLPVHYVRLNEAIEIVKQEAEKYEECYKDCGDCEAYNKEKYHCPKFCEVIKETVKEIEENHNGWIPVEEELPKDCDNRFYMCIVENHEEDLPMFCQYDEEYGFGFWHDIYDEHTLGFVDSEFKTNEELGYEEVIAWQPLPQPYQPKGE